MRHVCTSLVCLGVATIALLMLGTGCRSGKKLQFGNSFASSDSARGGVTDNTAARVLQPTSHYDDFGYGADSTPPTTCTGQLPEQFRTLTLDEAIAIGFESNEILRSLNALVLRNPQQVASNFDPEIQAADPLFGIDAALAEFDARFNAGLNYANNDDVFNNAIVGGGANEIQQDLATGTVGLQKVSQAGTRFSLRGNTIYDDNTRPSNLFDSAYTTLFEATARHPLLQGNGRAFNQIAGPNARPGFRNTSGIAISRINNEVSVVQFQQQLRDYVDEVIRSYWQLELAYRRHTAAQSACEAAEQTWQMVKTRYDNDLSGGEADKEAQAREQYLQFQGQLVAAINGDASGGTAGVLQAEANLRRLLDLQQSDGLFLKPGDQPVAADTIYDWEALAQTAIANRIELQQQQLEVKRRELELLASRNFTKPRLDALATYRNNGFGDTLGSSGNNRFDSALQIAGDGLYDEWEVGLQLDVPLGYRQARAGVRHAELQLRRGRLILQEQQKQILHDLGSAVRQADHRQLSVSIADSRLKAARETVEARQAAFDADAARFDELLNAQQRLADAEVNYYRELTELAIAGEAVQRESGNLLTAHFLALE